MASDYLSVRVVRVHQGNERELLVLDDFEEEALLDVLVLMDYLSAS